MAMKQAQLPDTTVIDFGSHYYPRLPDVIMPDGKGDRNLDHLVGVKRMGDPETVIAELKSAGIDAMAYTNNSFLGFDDANQTATANDAVLESVEEYDEFYGLAALPVGAGGDAAAAEFERSIEMGLQGAGLNENDVGLTDQEMEPVLEVADQTGAPIFVHSPTLGTVDYRFNAIFGKDNAQQKSISKVIHDGIYDRYPNVKMVWHHLGGNLATMLGRFHLHADPGRWPNQESMKSFAEFKADFEERVYIDSSGYFGYTAPIRIALEELPSTQILFGTDYPWEPRSGKELSVMVNAIKESGINRDVERILGQNALDIMVNINSR